MCPGNVIEYQASTGRRLRITATGIVERMYFFDMFLKFEVGLTPRPSRWYGARGLYRPVGVRGTHMVIDEAVQHFASVEEANDWVRLRVRADSMASIDEDGLFVMWNYATRPPGFEGGPDAVLSVDVYQLLVNLKVPHGLDKVSDDVIVKNLDDSCDARGLESGYAPSQPAVLSGRMYSGRALDFMREMGYDSTDVERLIANGSKRQNGTSTRQDGTETVYYSKPFDRPDMVRVDGTGRIVSIS
jgi:hypothetical protein